MTEAFSGARDLTTAAAATWAVSVDPEAIGRILPDCESVAPDGSGGLNVVVAIRQMFMTVRVDLHVTWHDANVPGHLRLELDGRPRGLGGSLRLSVPVEVEPIAGGCRVSYRATLELEGALASFRRQVSEGLQAQVDRLVKAIEHEAAGST